MRGKTVGAICGGGVVGLPAVLVCVPELSRGWVELFVFPLAIMFSKREKLALAP